MEEINLFLSVLKSPTQIGFDGVLNLEPNISCLGPFKLFLPGSIYTVEANNFVFEFSTTVENSTHF